MAETSKNKIYYNDDENSVADVLTDMKKMAGSTDKAIENSKYDDAQIKKDISDAKKEQALKDTEQDNKIIELQNEKAELEKELKEAQEDFYQNSIRGQASGEYIHVEDSSNCRAKIGIGGNHEQETRSGKNYLNTLAKYKAGDTVTIEGITYTFNNDGSITLNGTASATANSNLDFSVDAQKINGTNKKIVGLLTGSQVPSKMALTAYTSTWGANPTLTFSEVNKSLTINMQSNAEYTIFRISVYSGTTVNNQTVYYQILDTSVNDLTYEQYGASPSPNYPSEVKCVGSNINIFDKDNPDMFLNGLTPDNSGNIVSTLTDTTKTNYIITIIVPCKGNKQYTISRWLSGKTFIVYESEKNKFNINDKVTLLKRNDNSGIINETIATSANAKYILVKIYSTWVNEENTYNDLISSIKIEKGTVATPWSQHGQGCIKVTKCNKNLFDKNTTTDGKYIGGNGSIQTQSNIMHSDYIQIKTNINYYITGRSDLSRVALYDKNKTFLEITSTTQPNGVLNITNSNCKYIIINALLTNKDTLQLEEGTSTAYEEHQEQSYIMPVQQEMLEGDYFDFENEEEVHTWNKLVLDGNEKYWEVQNSGNRFYLNSSLLKAAIFPNNVVGEIYCTHFKRKTANNTWNGIEGISYANQTIAISCRSIATDVSTFIEYLKSQYDAETPVTIYYKLATPTRLPFTDEQKAVAKELNNARTYKNVTNITTDSIAIIDLDYAKDLETLLNNTQALAVNNASEGV